MSEQPQVRRPPRTREATMARVLLIGIPTTLLVVTVVVRLFVTSDYVSRELAVHLAGRIANRARASVQLSGVSFAWNFAPCLHDLQMNRFSGSYQLRMSTKRACVERWSSALGSGFHAVSIRLDEPRIQLAGQTEGQARPAFVDVKPKQGKRENRKSALREIQISFDDLSLDWSDLPIPDRFRQGSFGPIDGNVTVQMRSGRSAASLTIREPTTGSTVNGRITPTDEGWDLSAGAEGDLVPIFGNFLEDSQLDIRQLPSKGTVGMRYVSEKKILTVDLDMAQQDVDLANRHVSKGRLVGFSAREKARIVVNVDKRRLAMEGGIVEINQIPVVLSLRLAEEEDSPAFFAKAELKSTPLLRLLRSVPGSDEPEFARDLSPNVFFAMSGSVQGKLRDPSTWEPKLEYSMQGLDQEGVITGLEFLDGPFEYFPLTKQGRSETALVKGPGTEGWIPYKRIPYVQRRAIIVSEDSTFPFHRGLEIEEVRAAIQEAMESDDRARGGSTLSQQLVKNLFLSRDRTALRKVQELLITFLLESVLTKDQIFEAYANLIEWGPSIYGIADASEHYFGRPPRRLQAQEMVYLATIIPGPLLYHKHYDEGRVSGRHMGRVRALLNRLNRLGQLSNEALAGALETRIRFHKREKNRPPEKKKAPGDKKNKQG
ncbi:MAG: biosynthetic peptidoglycan transglycosylase [Deltaproteobacteria bacterium]